MITVTLPKELGCKGFVTTVEVTYAKRCSNELNKLRYVHSIGGTSIDMYTPYELRRGTSPSRNGSKKISNDQELIQSDPISCPQNQKGNNRFYGRPTSPSASSMAQNIQLFGPRGGFLAHQWIIT